MINSSHHTSLSADMETRADNLIYYALTMSVGGVLNPGFILILEMGAILG
jgi:hypothetical protein